MGQDGEQDDGGLQQVEAESDYQEYRPLRSLQKTAFAREACRLRTRPDIWDDGCAYCGDKCQRSKQHVIPPHEINKGAESHTKVCVAVKHRVEKASVWGHSPIRACHGTVKHIKKTRDKEGQTTKNKTVHNDKDKADRTKDATDDAENVGTDEPAPKKEMIDPHDERVQRMAYSRAYQELFLSPGLASPPPAAKPPEPPPLARRAR